jgi:hypothetical protein
MSNNNEPSAEDVVAVCEANARACPMPQRWIELWQMLPDRKQVGAGYEPSTPLILAAWHHIDDAEKGHPAETSYRMGCQQDVFEADRNIPWITP